MTYLPATAAQLRKLSERLDQLIADRNYYIHQMRQQGASLRAIAEVADLSPAGVAKILKKANGR